MGFNKKSYRELVDETLAELKRESELTDTNIGSVTRTLVETVARELAILYDQMDLAYKAGFVDTATDRSLDLVVSILGIERKSAQYATGTVTFQRRNASREVIIPVGTRVSTRGTDPTAVKIFETTLPGKLPRGVNTVEVPIRALEPGEKGVADLETITELESPIIGVDSVINKRPTTFGSEPETDEELRARAKATVLSAGKTTEEALRNAVLAVPGVRTVMINDMPEGLPGEIDVIIDGLDLSDPDSPQYFQVQEAIRRARPIGIKVNIKSVDVVKVYSEVFVRLTEVARTDRELQRVIRRIESSVTGYINGLKVGEKILRNRLINLVLNNKDVYNLEDISLTTQVFDEELGTMVEDTRKRLEPGTQDLIMGSYERPHAESVRVYTQYTPHVSSYLHLEIDVVVRPTYRGTSLEALRDRIEGALFAHLQRLRGGEEIDYIRVRNIVRSIEGVAEVKELYLTAIHEETGAVVSRTTTDIRIGNNETPRLGEVRVELWEE